MAANHPLPLNRPDPYGWDVTPGADGTVIFSYTLYGDRTDGTYVGIDQQHAHLNMPATLCYATGLEGRPAEMKFDLPAGWKVATQLRPGADKSTLHGPQPAVHDGQPGVAGRAAGALLAGRRPDH